MSCGRLVLLLTSPRVLPGLMSRAAWQVLGSAGQVLCADLTDAVPAAVADSGVPVLALATGSTPAQRAALLVERAREQDVVWLMSPDADPGLTDALAVELSRVAASADPPSVEVMVGSEDVPGARLLDVVAVMDRLRGPGGCPWDGEQTHASLVPYLLEEAYETVEAIEAGTPADVCEELGDVLLQVVFHARVAAEHPAAPFSIDDVAAGLVDKLVRRHPHVFAGTADLSAGDVERSWHEIKAAEKGRANVLDGVPEKLPALARADKVLGRLARAGGEPTIPAQAGAVPSPAQAVGVELLDVVRRARVQGVDAEGALRETVRTLESRFREQVDDARS